MNREFENLIEIYSSVKDGETVIALTQHAYIDNNVMCDGAIYKCHGIDQHENEYEIEWDVLPPTYDEEGQIEERDGENDCDWDNPSKITKS